ncbi:MAG: response regulator, partial [Pseudomonadota bacterium]
MTQVLIVDDKEENLYYLEALLTAHGCTVMSARHGAEALFKARAAPPKLIISDLLMPVMDGYTLLRHWKASAQLRHIPFIVYTATYTEEADEKLARDLGADAFILKPAEPEEFLARVQQVQANAVAAVPLSVKQPLGDENAMLEVYSQALIRKLEEKSLQLEESNA